MKLLNQILWFVNFILSILIELFLFTKKFITKHWNYIFRHGIYLFLLFVVVILFSINGLKVQETNAVLLNISAIELLALFFSNVANTIYTELKFSKDAPNVTGYIFLGVHIMVGLSVFGIYYVQFAH